MPVSKSIAQTGRTRKQHIAWCKERALAELPHSPANAVSSMVSDLTKHPQTNTQTIAMLGVMGMMEIQRGSEAVRRWVEGFN